MVDQLRESRRIQAQRERARIAQRHNVEQNGGNNKDLFKPMVPDSSSVDEITLRYESLFGPWSSVKWESGAPSSRKEKGPASQQPSSNTTTIVSSGGSSSSGGGSRSSSSSSGGGSRSSSSSSDGGSGSGSGVGGGGRGGGSSISMNSSGERSGSGRGEHHRPSPSTADSEGRTASSSSTTTHNSLAGSSSSSNQTTDKNSSSSNNNNRHEYYIRSSSNTSPLPRIGNKNSSQHSSSLPFPSQSRALPLLSTSSLSSTSPAEVAVMAVGGAQHDSSNSNDNSTTLARDCSSSSGNDNSNDNNRNDNNSTTNNSTNNNTTTTTNNNSNDNNNNSRTRGSGGGGGGHPLLHRFRCEECKKTFTQASSLKRHKEEIHESTGFICPICEYRFPRKSKLLAHLNRRRKCQPHSVPRPKPSRGTGIKRHSSSNVKDTSGDLNPSPAKKKKSKKVSAPQVNIPSELVMNRHVCTLRKDLVHSNFFNDQLSFFRCLALHKKKGDLKALERSTRAQFQKWKAAPSTRTSNFKGITLSDLDHIEEVFCVSIKVYEYTPKLQSSFLLIWGQHNDQQQENKDILQVLLLDNHFMYIKDFNGLVGNFECCKCGKLWKERARLERHEKACKSRVS